MSTQEKKIHIDWELSIRRASGNQAFAEEFLAYFVKELDENRKEFIQLQQTGNLQGIEDAAHRLYGACCFCGVPFLQERALHLEKKAKTATTINELESAITTLIDSLDQVVNEFKNHTRN